jgi:hypothetical protein
VLGSTDLVAWSALTLYGNDLTLPAFCSAGTLWAVLLVVSFDLALVFNSPAKLATGSSLRAGR